MTARESVAAKAARYLREGRLVVTRVDGDLVEAECRGTSDVYSLGYDPAQPGGWWCMCPVRTGKCSHLAALMLITIRRRPE